MGALNWTPEQDAILRQCATDGMSAGQIRAAHFPDKSRNAVIGRIHRIGAALTLKDRFGQAPGTSKAAKLRENRKRLASQAANGTLQTKKRNYSAETELFSAKSISFMELNSSHCRYIIGDVNGAETVYCGCQVDLASSYCPHHVGKCYGREPSQQRFRTTYGVVF
jgi:GcrA cell cycle regulator